MQEIRDLVSGFLEAEAAAGKAAMSEPSDDKYLKAEAAAKSLLHSEPGSVLALIMGRYAVPGGRDDSVTPEAGESIHPRTLFAIARYGLESGSTWRAFVGALSDPSGWDIEHALVVAEIAGEKRIVGRDAVNSFADELAWEHLGGRSMIGAGAPEAVEIYQRPGSARHAEFLDDLAGQASDGGEAG